MIKCCIPETGYLYPRNWLHLLQDLFWRHKCMCWVCGHTEPIVQFVSNKNEAWGECVDKSISSQPLGHLKQPEHLPLSLCRLCSKRGMRQCLWRTNRPADSDSKSLERGFWWVLADYSHQVFQMIKISQ